MFRTFIFDSNNKLLVKGDITIDDGTSNYIVLQSDSNDLNSLRVNGNTKVTSNVYVLNKLGVGTSNPTERVDVIDNLKASSNLYVMNWIGAGNSNPTERIDIVGNSKVRSNLYVLSNLSISHSNPTEKLDINGNAKVSSNVYVMSKIGVNTSNPAVGLEVNTTDAVLVSKGTTAQRPSVPVLGHVRYNTDNSQFEGFGAGNAWGSLGGVKSTNQQTYVSAEEYPTSNDDNIRFFNSNIESMRITRQRLVGINTSNPSERVDIVGNTKVSSNVYVLNRVGINTSNPAVGLEVNTTDAVLVSKGTTAQRPSVPVLGHVRYNTDNSQFEGFGAGNAWGSLGGVKSTNQQTYVSAEEYPTSNDDNIRFFNSNIESMRITRQRLVGINTSNPSERVDIVGNTKVSSNVYVLNRVGINTSNPAVGLEVNTTDAVLVSKGTTAQRPSVPVLGHVRYNTDNSQFEGFGAGNAWGSLGGVKSTNQQTYVSAEEYPTSNDDNIRFFNSNIESMRITRQRLVGINTSNPSERVDIVGNTKVSSNVYVLNRVGINTSNPAVGLEVNTTDAVLVSKGTTAQRPSVPVLGHVRYNTDNSQFEGFGAGNAWGSLGGVKSTNQQTYVSAEEYPTSNDDNIRFFNSNIESMRITRQRLVGINTSNPSERVDIVGNVKISSNEYVMGNVGIGTSNPAYKLDVVGEARVQSNLYIGMDSGSTSGTYTTGKILFGGPAGDTGYPNAQIAVRRFSGTGETSELVIAKFNDADIASGPDRVRIRAAAIAFDCYSNAQGPTNTDNDFAASNIRMYIMENGNVGIGTTTPSSQLEVIGDAKTTTITTSNVSTSNLSSSNMRTCNLDVNTISASNIVTSNLVIVNSNISTNNITAQETVVSSNIYTSNLYSSRRIGVGTQDPQYTLEVQGDVYVTGPSILSNSLKVTGPMTLCNSLNVSGATLLSNSLTTYGATTLSNTVTISGATTLSNTLNVSGATLLSNALTTYNGTTTHSNAVIVSGITTLSNSLNVSGPMTLCNTMNVAGATLLSNTLLTYGATTLSNTLNISGATTLSNTLNVSGTTLLSNALTTYNGTTTHSNAVIVSGITTLSNNVNVSGPMTLCNSMNVSGSALLSNILLVYGATTLSNTVTVSGATSLSNTLNVYGASLLSNTLTTYNGTTTHSNAVIVSGITTLSNNLNVSGPMTLCNSMNVAGAALLSNTLLTYGATTLSNTLTISGATTLSNTLNVSGTTLLSNALTTYNGTTTHSNDVIISGVTTLSNDLDVSGPMTLCNTINVAGAALLSNTLLTYGATTLSNTLTISGATTLSNTLNVSGATLLSNALTTYNGTTTHSNAVIVSGITTLSNNLNVSGPMTLCNSINVSGAALLSNTLLTYGATTLSNTVRISGATTLSNTLNVSGATVLSNALTTYNGTTTHSNNVIISGITTLSNELDVSGAMTLCNTINVSGAALLSNTLLTYGATTLSNTLTISGATTLSNTLNVSGVTLLSNALTTYNGTTTHSNAVVVSGITTLSNNLNVSGPMTLCNSMNVSGVALLSNNVNIYGVATISNALNVSGATTLSNTLQAYGVTTLSSNLYVSGPTSLSNSLDVSGVTTLSNILLTYGPTTLSNNVIVSGTTLLSNALTTYNGTTTHSNAVIVSGITTLSNNLNVSGPMTLCNSLNVSGAALLSNTVTTYGATTLSNTLVVSGATSLSNNLNVSGATTLSNGITVYNGTSVLSNNTYISGNVGIGTSSTNAKLDVRGAIYIDGATGQYPTASFASKKEFVRFGATDGANDYARIYGEGATNSGKLVIAIQDDMDSSEALIFRGEKTDGTTRDNMVVRNDGLVGIGTSSMTEKLQVASGKIYSDTQLLGNSNDSASVPSFSFKEDSNTGMFHPSNDAIGFTTNGSEKMRIDTNGNVGIGTTTPTEKVEIVGTTKVTSNMYVMSKLGVGTSNISTACNFLLHVAGDTRIDGNLDVTGIFSVTNTDVKLTDQFTISNNGTGPGLKVYQMGANHIADFYDDATLALRVADGGSVGIKTGTPTEVLDVVGNTKVSGNTYVMTQLGVGTSNLLYTLDVAGTQRTTGATMLSNTLLVYGASTFSNSTTTTGVATISNNLNVSGVSSLLGGSKIVVQGGVDGGSNVGIFTWSAADTNWGIYTAQPGAGKSLANGNAVAGAGIPNHATRLRVADNSAQGIVFENSSDKLLMSVRGGDGYTFFSSNVGFGTSNWTERLQVAGKIHSDTQVLGTSNDTVSRPSFSFKEDSNTGIYHPTGTSTIAITTGGTERLRVDNAGNVGIATTGATEKLQVTGKIYSDTQVLATTNDSVSVPSFSFKENSNTGIYHAGTDTIGITTGGTERVRVDNVGNVGIGVLPTTTLDVNGSMLLRNGNSLGIYSSNQLMFAWNNGSNYKHAVKSRHNSGADNTQNAIDFYLWQTSQLITDVGNKQVLSITSPGVGIFNSNPAYSLDVTGTINSTGNVTGPTITSLSNLGMFSSNTAISASNTTISLSNYVYGTNTTNITNAQTTANWASNAGLFGSNTAISASNTTISLSNYVYGTNTTNITSAQTTADWASNAGLFGSNNSVSAWNYINTSLQYLKSYFQSSASSTNNIIKFVYTGAQISAKFILTSYRGTSTQEFSAYNEYDVVWNGRSDATPVVMTAKRDVVNLISSTKMEIPRWVFNSSVPSLTLEVSKASTGFTMGVYLLVSGTTSVEPTAVVNTSTATGTVLTPMYTQDESGNVGIGLSNPSNKLDVAGKTRIQAPSSSNILTVQTNNNAIGEVAGIMLGIPSGQGATIESITQANNITDLRFWTTPYNLSSVTSNMTLFLSGNSNAVGIGTSNPLYTLDVSGTINSSGNLTGPTITSLSNLGVFNSNTSVWSSNNLFNKAGGTISGNVVVTGTTALSNTVTLYATSGGGAATIVMNSTSGSGGRDYRILSTLTGNAGGAGAFQIYDQTAVATRLHIDSTGKVGIGTSAPAQTLDVSGTINSSGNITGPTITSLSNLGMFASNTSISASNTTISLSNYVYGTNTTNITSAQTTANWASNAGLFGSNTAVSASNTTISLSNYTYGTNTTNITSAQTTADWASNAGLFGSNNSVSAWNYINTSLQYLKSYFQSSASSTNNIVKFVYTGAQISAKFILTSYRGTSTQEFSAYNEYDVVWNGRSDATPVVMTAKRDIVNLLSSTKMEIPRWVFNSSVPSLTLEVSKASTGFSMGVYLLVSGTTSVEPTAVVNTSTATGTAITPLYTQDESGNVGIGLSNPSNKLDVAGTINATGEITAPTITSLSNLGVFSSNTAISASNTTISLSNYVYGTNTTNITNAQTTADWASNAGLFGSNYAVWSSNNMVNRTSNAEINGNLALTNGKYFWTKHTNSPAPSLMLWTTDTTAMYHGIGIAANQMRLVIPTVNHSVGVGVQSNNIFTELFRFAGSGNCGIGTTNPMSKLEVSGTITASAPVVSLSNTTTASNYHLTLYNSQNSNTNISTGIAFMSTSANPSISTPGAAILHERSGTGSTGHLHFATKAGTSSNDPCDIRMTINSNGNVGVGISNPSYKLDVNGDINFTGTFRQNGTPYIGSQWSNNSSNVFLFGSNVGLGLSNPSYSLDVVGTTRTTGQLLVPGGSNCLLLTNGDPGDMVVKAYGTAGDRYGMGQYNAGITRLFTSSTYSGSIRLSAPTNDVRTGAATFTDYLTVLAGTNANAGNVGIGTSTPSSALDVNGTVRIGGGGSDTSSHLHINTTDGDKIRLTNLGSAGSKITHTAGWSTNFLAGPGTSASGILTFQTSTASGWSERMRVANDGSVGIGTSAPTERLQVSSGKIYSDTQLLGNSNDSLTTPSFSFKENSNTGIFHACNDTVGLVAGGVEALRASSYNTTITSNLTVGSNIVANGNITMNNRLVVSTLKINRKSGIDVNVTSTSVLGFSNVSTGIILDVGSNAPASGQSMRVTWSNNTELMRITGDGNVGIGTNTPAYKLHVSSNASANGSIISVDNPNTGVGAWAAVAVRNSGSPALGGMRMGMLGTGWTSSGIYQQNGGFLECGQSNGISIAATSNTGTLRFYTGGNTEAMRINSNQNIGIGTTSPSYKFDVQGTVGITNAGGKKLQFPNDATTNRHIVLFENTNNEHQYFGFGINADTLRYQVDANGRHAFFCGTSSTTSTELMRIQGNGNVGIGTTTPSYKLDVSGDIRATTSITTGSSLWVAGDVRSTNTTTTYNIGSYVYGQVFNVAYSLAAQNADGAKYATAGCTSIRGQVLQWGGGSINVPGAELFLEGGKSPNAATVAGSMLFKTDNTERMRINESGNVGIGTTSPAYRLEVSGTTYLNGGSKIVVQDSQDGGTGRGIFMWNGGDTAWAMYMGQSGASKSISGGTAVAGAGFSSYSIRFRAFNQSPSGFIFENSSEQLVASIRASDGLSYFAGNVGIGTTSPSYKLHVSGDIYATGNVTAYSDMRAKSNLDVITEPLYKVSQLTGYTYDMIDNPDLTTKITPRFTGIIAQDLEKVLPEAVHKDTDGKYSVAYGNMAGLFVESIKELVKENTELKNKVSTLEERLEALERLIGSF